MYQQQHLYGTMGLSKIYEIVLNSNPGLAFLLETNPEIANLLVAAHVFGHEVRRTEDDISFLRNSLSATGYSLGTAKPKVPGQTALDVTAAAALRTGDEDHVPAARGPRDASAHIVIFVTWLQPSPQNMHPPLQKGG